MFNVVSYVVLIMVSEGRWIKNGETTQQGAPRSFCDTTGYSFLSSWNERS